MVAFLAGRVSDRQLRLYATGPARGRDPPSSRHSRPWSYRQENRQDPINFADFRFTSDGPSSIFRPVRFTLGGSVGRDPGRIPTARHGGRVCELLSSGILPTPPAIAPRIRE